MSAGDLGHYDQAYVDKQAPVVHRLLERYFRPQVDGLANVPDIPFLGVGNHGGGTLMPDTFVWTSAYHTSKRAVPLLTLSHSGIFSVYPRRLVRSLSRLGAIRADARVALAALRQGNAVQVYPGGDRDACRRYGDRNRVVFAGHRGYVKLAQKAKVPIVPVVSIGAQEALMILWDGAPLARLLRLDTKFGLQAFPLSLCLPWGIWLGPLPGYVPLPTKIAVKVLPPIDPQGRIEAVDDHVRGTMQACLDEMAANRRFLGIGQ